MLTPSLPPFTLPFTQSKAWRLLAGRYAILSTIFLSACMLFGAPKPAFAWLKICNRAYEKIEVAVATYDPGGSASRDARPGESSLAVMIPAGWTSKGWWHISPGDCAVVHGKIRNRYSYIRLSGGLFDWLDKLKSRRGMYVDHSSTFCTDQAAFHFIKRDGDSSRTYCTSNRYQSFVRIDTKKSYVNYTCTIYPQNPKIYREMNKLLVNQPNLLTDDHLWQQLMNGLNNLSENITSLSC